MQNNLSIEGFAPWSCDPHATTVDGFVETSTNLAVLNLREDGLHITTLQRRNMISRLAAKHELGIAGKTVKVYESLFQQKADVGIGYDLIAPYRQECPFTRGDAIHPSIARMFNYCSNCYVHPSFPAENTYRF